jgi:hypothetical protein
MFNEDFYLPLYLPLWIFLIKNVALDVPSPPGVPYDPAVVSKMLCSPHQAYPADLSSYGPMYSPYYKQQQRAGPYPPAYRPGPYYYEYPAAMPHTHLPR